MICFGQQIGHVLRRMPRSMARCYEHFAKCEPIAVLYFFRSEAVLSPAFPAGINLCRFKTRTKLARSADQIGMNMRLQDMRYGEPRFACHLNINIDIGSRIENRPDSFVIIAKQVRKFGDAFGLNRFKYERHRSI